MEDDFDEYFDDGSFDDATLQQLDQAESHFNAHVGASSGPKEQAPTQKPQAGSSKWQQPPRPAPAKLHRHDVDDARQCFQSGLRVQKRQPRPSSYHIGSCLCIFMAHSVPNFTIAERI